MRAAAGWIRLYDQMHAYQEFDRAELNLMVAAILTGREVSIFGRPARIRIDWPEGAPMSSEQLARCGEMMRASALERLERITP